MIKNTRLRIDFGKAMGLNMWVPCVLRETFFTSRHM